MFYPLMMTTLNSCIKILRLYSVAYDEKLNTGVDEELSYCYLKIASLRKDKKFDQMFALDLQNRKTVMELLEKRLVANEKGEENKNGLSSIEPDPVNHQPEEISFLEMLIPINGSTENTLKLYRIKNHRSQVSAQYISHHKENKKGC